MDVVLKIFEGLKAREWMIATAESCTGGMIAARLTDVAGSSAYVDRGIVTYSNQAKIDLLNVPPVMIEEFGAVSPQVAEAMAKGALEASRAGIAVSVTGIAGPGGGSEEKPVGLVYICVATWEKTKVHKHNFRGDRAAVRAHAVDAALKHVAEALQ